MIIWSHCWSYWSFIISDNGDDDDDDDDDKHTNETENDNNGNGNGVGRQGFNNDNGGDRW